MKFIVTKELGRLAKWLRILGFDTEYFSEQNAGSLIILALREERIIITRNSRLPKTKGVRVVLIGKEKIKEQVSEVLRVLDISPEAGLVFSRCIICNVELAGIEKEAAKDRVPEYVFRTQGEFITCPKCNRIYWQGTHWGNVAKTLKEISG